MTTPALPYTRHCFVCGAENPHGLQLRFYRDGQSVVAGFTPQPHHAGFRGIVHGGLIATALDEAMFWAAACQTKRFCLAAELTVRFIRKVVVGQSLQVVAWLEADRGRLWESSAVLRDAAGVVYAKATCKQIPMDDAAMQDAARDFLPAADALPVADLFPTLAPPA